MKTSIPATLLDTAQGQEAESILRACVHCGFCLATCPTYQVEGNELDSPRGRIYLIKNMLEGEPVTAVTRNHLDRCLTCQACETTCPSDVNYHRLLAIGRSTVSNLVPRPLWQQWLRSALVRGFAQRRMVALLLKMGRPLAGLSPAALRAYLQPQRAKISPPAVVAGSRSVILVQGCVQPGLSPTTNAATSWVLAQLGIGTLTVATEVCCGALAAHLDAEERAAQQARANIDAWWPHLDAGAEAIVMTATGCSNQVIDYGRLLADDPEYAERAAAVTEKVRDVAQILLAEDLSALAVTNAPRISWHCPCTGQHGQSLDAPVKTVLQRLGFAVPVVRDSHLCCGSAGTYSLLQPKMAKELRQRKLLNLESSDPEQIVTANIGCQVHLAGGTNTPVVHWIELLARSLQTTIQAPVNSERNHV
ncbi:glycolate oxidase subunit GlcF [Halieaceae bacterium IMCC14734]|uniref:Glycolate oxidase iron-sulfur subunit n=1 Tax=Candidatus Litorirhabdus singularis TaxID=2518993 RepID=A0ABT3TFW9_9GAMM|nr:glycolate oxidase subunit GlcF [Candidatus Litorirhabdus singularis]MCX2980312.1 glycolate oxidase subunit GlcF [Candidatus Litorirhabdus singularis]